MVRFHLVFMVSAVGTLLFPMASPVAAASQDDGGQASSVPNIQVTAVLVPVFTELLAESPTFAAQVLRIADTKYVRVVVNVVLGSSTTSRGTARTTMRRFASGLLLASVEMPVPLTSFEYAELFGHELEHVIEQIDHVDLEALRVAGKGASRLSDGSYETTRARRAGQAIANETERRKPVVVTPVAIR